jgi:trimethylamine--corrinoid protein Co-methyltransferase
VKTLLQVLSDEEKDQIHERTLRVMAETGVRVDTARGREILLNAGAQVDEQSHIVRFPHNLVEEALQLAPKQFSLGARRPGWDLEMNAGQCTLCADGEGMFVGDWETGDRRESDFKDWLTATRLTDAIDEFGVYWSLVEAGGGDGSIEDSVKYWRSIFSNFSKHVQDATAGADHSSWLLEVLQVIFGDKETIRREHPFSFLVCPQSPLIIDEQYTDGYLELLGWDIPIAVMPMPLMGGTSPGSLISTVILGNCEVLAMLCIVQAGAPGTPFIYAPALAISDPRSGVYAAGSIENGLLGAAATEIARYYGIPVESSGGGTSHFIPTIQGGYERALNSMLPVLSWPDILVGGGLLGGSMYLSLEQLVIDVEVFRMNRRAFEGLDSAEDKWLDDVISRVGPGGYFMGDRSTVKNLRSGEWYISKFGWHSSYEAWSAAGKPTLLEEARDKVQHILEDHEPLPLDDHVERELDLIQERAREASRNGS